MGWGLMLSLPGGIGGWGIAVYFSTYLWLCCSGSWVWVGLVYGVVELGVGRADVAGLLCTGLFARTAPTVCVSVIT